MSKLRGRYGQRSDSFVLERREDSLVGELTPSVISSLLFDQFVKVEISIELIRFCSRIAEDSFLIELFGDLGEARIKIATRFVGRSKGYSLQEFVSESCGVVEIRSSEVRQS